MAKIYTDTEKQKAIIEALQNLALQYGEAGQFVERTNVVIDDVRFLALKLHPGINLTWQMIRGVAKHQVTKGEWDTWIEQGRKQGRGKFLPVSPVPVGTATGPCNEYTDKDYKRDSVQQMLDPADDDEDSEEVPEEINPQEPKKEDKLDREIVCILNACLDREKLQRLLTRKESRRLADLIYAGGTGRIENGVGIVFLDHSGSPGEFALEYRDGSRTTCTKL